jgi:hypothetical protein
MRHRRVTAAPFALITSFFAIGISNVHIQTMFSHLLPKDDPFVRYSAHLHVFDSQTGRMTRLEQVRATNGGHVTSVNDVSIYDRYLTTVALMRLGDA